MTRTAAANEPAWPGHRPVLSAETVELLEPPPGGGWIVDATVGLGGHAEAILERWPEARLAGCDRDPWALERAAARLARFGGRVRFARASFSELEERLGELGVAPVVGVLADLGVSSLQLDSAERGFSFARDGPLDMRMGDDGTTAAEIVNTYPEDALSRILRDYGEEKDARRIARALVAAREEKPLETTAELEQLVERVKPVPPWRRPRIHPATQTFQALRIEVNRELDELRALLEGSLRLLEGGGKLVVISYHSLEDRIVKHTLRDLATGEIEPVTGRPRAETQVIEVLTRRPVRPSEAEVAANPRSRSARLRAARRL